MTNSELKELLFRCCLKYEAAVQSAKSGADNTIQKVKVAGGADALRELIRAAGLEEEYRSFYYRLALRAAEEVLDRAG